MKKRSSLLGLVMLITVVPSVASDLPSDVLTIDEGKTFEGALPFVKGSEQEPERSEFKIENYILMSSSTGERWATVTLRNSSSGQRIAAAEHLMAVFANGEKRAPHALDYKFSAGEVATFTLNFGTSKFPVLYLYIRN